MNDSYLDQLLGEGEQILFVTRRHWLVLAGEIVSETLLTLALIVLVSILLLLPPPVGNPLWALGYLLLAFPLVSLARDVMTWSNRKFVVTNQRVIHLEGVLSKEITDSSLEKVNDVKLEQSFWGRVFGYGNVQILTASELGASRFTRIANPIQFKTAMLNAKNRLGQDDDQRPRPPREAAARPRATEPKRNGLLERVQMQQDEPAPTQPNPPAPSAQAGNDIPALLRQLDELRKAGLLTDAEFQSKKTQLLERL